MTPASFPPIPGLAPLPGLVPLPGSPAGTAWAALCGALVGLGATILLTAVRPSGHPAPHGPDGRVAAFAARVRRDGLTGPLPGRAAITVAAFLLVGLVTRWPVAALLAAVGASVMPPWWRPDAVRARTDRSEAVAIWTELLRDTLSAAAGLEQAILTTTTTAPAPLAIPVAELTARLRDGQPLPDALRAFADDVDDPTMDLVVAALVLAATGQARDLAGLLSTLAQAARDQVVLRLRVNAGRARVRTSARIVLATTLVMATALVLLNRPYLAIYDSAEGQLVLLAVGSLFALAFTWLNRISAIPTPPRILPPATPPVPHDTAPAAPLPGSTR